MHSYLGGSPINSTRFILSKHIYNQNIRLKSESHVWEYLTFGEASGLEIK